MEKEQILNEVKKIVNDILSSEGIELVEISYLKGRRNILKILVDKPGGINLSDCEMINKNISSALDNSSFSINNYLLEVSSPGLDRPLLNLKDFKRVMGRRIKVKLKVPLEGNDTYKGILYKLENDYLYLRGNNKEIKIPILNIMKSTQDIES